MLDGLIMSSQKGYVCVADGVTLAMSSRNKCLKEILTNSALTVCDSAWVPIYLKIIYGIDREQYSGSDLLEDIVSTQKYRMLFLGTNPEILTNLKYNLSKKNRIISRMTFLPLPFKNVDEFDYNGIATTITDDSPDIIFVSLGMPKQEFFMQRILPYLEKGVLIGVGAAFKFHSGLSNQRRAPQWMIKAKLEWWFRLFCEPRKQIKRCWLIISTTPRLFFNEFSKSRKSIL